MQKLEIFQLRLSKVRYSTCYIFYDNWNTDSLFCWQCIQRDISYNPRARMGRDGVQLPQLLHGRCFNPRARMGRDYLSVVSSVFDTAFQSTRPHGARLQGGATVIYGGMFQSTRPHGARRSSIDSQARRIHVSIHAPAWGATSTLIASSQPRQFQSTRPHGARRGHQIS